MVMALLPLRETSGLFPVTNSSFVPFQIWLTRNKYRTLFNFDQQMTSYRASMSENVDFYRVVMDYL